MCLISLCLLSNHPISLSVNQDNHTFLSCYHFSIVKEIVVISIIIHSNRKRIKLKLVGNMVGYLFCNLLIFYGLLNMDIFSCSSQGCMVLILTRQPKLVVYWLTIVSPLYHNPKIMHVWGVVDDEKMTLWHYNHEIKFLQELFL